MAPKPRFYIDELAIRRPIGHDQKVQPSLDLQFAAVQHLKPYARGEVSWQSLVCLRMVRKQ